MRILECIVILFAVINVFLLLMNKSKSRFGLSLASILIFSIFVQIVFEGYRWQLLPVILLSVFIFLFSLIGAQKNIGKSQKRLHLIWKVLVVFLVIGSILLPVIIPVFKLPVPTGRYQVGTQYLVFVDSTRMETYLPDEDLFREVPVQIYYPAVPEDSNQPESYWADAKEWGRIWMKAYGFGRFPFFWNHLKYVKTYAYPEAPFPASDERYPVILFSHGLWQFSKFNTSLLTELASHGYVVVSISHNHDSPLSVYPDGVVKVFSRNNPEFRKGVEEYNNLYSAGAIFKKISETDDEDGIISLYREFYELVPYTKKSIAIWVEDTKFCIDQLAQLNTNFFSNRLDLNRIGVTGFSCGGCVAGLMALQDERITAGVNLDGWQYGHTIGKNLTCPFMFINSEGHEWHTEFFFERAEHVIYDITIKGTRHANFNDMALALPVPGKLIGRLGKINSRYGKRLICRSVSSFFNHYLKGEKSNFLTDSLQTLSEVEMKIKTRKH